MSENKITAQNTGGHKTARVVSRRALLKGTAASMPMILTLQSGAALARSSNLISEAGYGATDARGRTLCLDLDSVHETHGSGNIYDLGEPAYARVSAINEREYHLENNEGSAEIEEADLCMRGGSAFYRDRGWHEVRVQQGVLVSATALTSFVGGIVVTDL